MKLIVEVDKEKNGKLLKQMLKEMSFVQDVSVEAVADELSATDLNILNKRWRDFEKHPEKFKTWDEIEKSVRAKNGL